MLRTKLPLALLGIIALAASQASAATVKIQFGSTVADWNCLTVPTDDIADLTDSTGGSTGITLTTDDTYRFGNVNTDGTTSPSSPASDLFPSDVTENSLYGNDVSWGGRIDPLAILVFSGLDTDMTYTFSVFASRSTTQNRETEYAFVGATSEALYLNPGNNTSEYVTTGALTPDASGEITLTVKKGPNNSNSYGFFYLGGMVIETAAVPEPATLSLLGVGTLALIRRRRRA